MAVFIFIFLTLGFPVVSIAQTGRLSLTVDVVGALPSLNLPSGANQGLGFAGTADYRLSDDFALGLTGGMVEFIAPTGNQDLKTTWLDLMGRLYPLAPSPGAEPYLQLGFGFSPYIGGIFEDYWSHYAAQNLNASTPSGSIYLNAQGILGFQFYLFGDMTLDAGFQYDIFWPPANAFLQTLSVRAGLVRSFGL